MEIALRIAADAATWDEPRAKAGRAAVPRACAAIARR